MPLSTMPDDELGLIVERVLEEDRLPLALVCKALSALCIAARDGNGWRTKATSTAARIKWAVQHMGATPTGEWCADLARRGDDVLLLFLSSRYSVPLDATVCAGAAAGGHVELLRFLHYELDVAWDESACYNAARYGHLDTLQWLCEMKAPFQDVKIDDNDGLPWNPCKWSRLVCKGAIQGSHLYMLEWLQSAGYTTHYLEDCAWRPGDVPWSCLAEAAECGNLQVVEWLYDRDRMPPQFVTDYEEIYGKSLVVGASLGAANKGHLHILKWMRSKGAQFTCDIWEYAALQSVDMLDWLLAQGTPLEWPAPEYAYDNAIRNGDIDAVKWLHAHSCPMEFRDTTVWCWIAACNGHIDMLRYLHFELGMAWDKANCIRYAERNGHSAAAEWLQAQP